MNVTIFIFFVLLSSTFTGLPCFANDVTLTHIKQATPAEAFDSLSPYVPPNGILDGEAMDLSFPTESTALLQKFQNAVASDPEWFKNYAKNAKPGEPLKWHVKMGLTESEYVDFINLSKKTKIVPTGKKIKFEVKRIKPNILKISALHKAKFDLLFDTEKNEIKTVFGTLSDFSTVNNQDPNLPTGEWSGLQWKVQQMKDEKDMKSISFTIGKLKNIQKGILTFDVAIIKNSENLRKSIIIYYPLPEMLKDKWQEKL